MARFPSPIGSGPKSPSDLRWFAVPYNVVCGESDPASRGKGAFTIPDGAYQIIPSTWGGAFGVSNAAYATPLQQHIRAHALWGTTPWYGSC